MSAVPIGYSFQLKHMAEAIRFEAERLERTIGHREMWLAKTDSNVHVVDAYARTVDNALDRVMAKACAAKEAVWVLRGGGL